MSKMVGEKRGAEEPGLSRAPARAQNGPLIMSITTTLMMMMLLIISNEKWKMIYYIRYPKYCVPFNLPQLTYIMYVLEILAKKKLLRENKEACKREIERMSEQERRARARKRERERMNEDW